MPPTIRRVELSPRILARVVRDFPGGRASEVADVLLALDPQRPHSPDGDERLCGAVLICAGGDVDRLLEAAALAELDWRDLFVLAGLEHDDWPTKLAAALAE
jgi:hypothetical protein